MNTNITVDNTTIHLTAIEKAEELIMLEKAYKEIKQKLDQYRADLLEETKRMNVLSLKTEAYTISRVKKTLPRVLNVPALRKALEQENIPYETQEVFSDHMTPVFKQLIEDGRSLDGLSAIESEYITIRVHKE